METLSTKYFDKNSSQKNIETHLYTVNTRISAALSKLMLSKTAWNVLISALEEEGYVVTHLHSYICLLPHELLLYRSPYKAYAKLGWPLRQSFEPDRQTEHYEVHVYESDSFAGQKQSTHEFSVK